MTPRDGKATTIPGVELTDEMLDAPEPAALVDRLATEDRPLDLRALDPDKAGVTEGVVNGERVKVVTGTPPPVRRRKRLIGRGGAGYTAPPFPGAVPFPEPRPDPSAPPVRTPQPAPERTAGDDEPHAPSPTPQEEFDLVGDSPPPPPLTPTSKTRVGRPPPPAEPTEERLPIRERGRARVWMGFGVTGIIAALALFILLVVMLGAMIFALSWSRAPAPGPTIPVPVVIPTLPVEDEAAVPPARPEPPALPEAEPEVEPEDPEVVPE